MNAGTPRPRRRWLQFSLRSILVLTGVLAVLIAWLGPKFYFAYEQRQAVAAILASGGQVAYDYQAAGEQEPPGPKWLRRLIGDDFFQRIDVVSFRGQNISDANLKSLSGMTDLHRLSIYSPIVTDAGLEHLKGVTGLRELYITANVTDAGMVKLKPLTKLTTLACSRFPVKGKYQLADALESKTECDFTNTPTRDVFVYFADRHDIPIQADTTEPDAIKLIDSSDITVSLNDTTLRAALETILHAGGLDWTGSPAGLLITTREKAAENRRGLDELRKSLPNLKSVSTDW